MHNELVTEIDSVPAGWAARQQRQAAGFDAIGAHYDEVFPHKEGQLHHGELLLARLPVGARVLDVGCGTGLPTAKQLAAAGCAVTGIDISPVMLDLARGNVPDASFLCRDVVGLGADLGQFHAVVAFFSLLMLPRREIDRTLHQLQKQLLPGGWLALGMVEADLDDVEVPFLGAPLRLTGLPRTRLRETVEAAGFTVHTFDERSYEPPTPDAPAETQLFVLARRD